jgi:hypothetical protein
MKRDLGFTVSGLHAVPVVQEETRAGDPLKIPVREDENLASDLRDPGDHFGTRRGWDKKTQAQEQSGWNDEKSNSGEHNQPPSCSRKVKHIGKFRGTGWLKKACNLYNISKGKSIWNFPLRSK